MRDRDREIYFTGIVNTGQILFRSKYNSPLKESYSLWPYIIFEKGRNDVEARDVGGRGTPFDQTGKLVFAFIIYAWNA